MFNNKFTTKIETCPEEGVFFRESKVERNNFPAETEWGIVNIYDDISFK